MSETPSAGPVDHIFGALRHSVLSALVNRPQDDAGLVHFTPQELGITLLAAAFGIAQGLGVTRADMQQIVERAMPKPLVVV